MTFRAPRHDDVDAIVELVSAYDAANGGEMEIDGDEVRDDWTYPGFVLEHDAWVAEDGNGRIVAYGWVGKRSETDYGLDGYIHPELRDPAVGAELFRHMEARARELGASVFVTGILGDDEWGANLLRDLGYGFVRAQFRMAIDLDGDPPAPAWPQGVAARSYRPGDEPAFHDVITEAFVDEWGYETQTLEEWTAEFVRRPTFDARLWFLAFVGTDAVAALMGYPLGKGGWVRAIGVRREWRRRGLGRALLLQSFHAFRAAGRTHVALAVDSSNPTGAPRVYRGVGMRETHRIDRYDKPATSR